MSVLQSNVQLVGINILGTDDLIKKNNSDIRPISFSYDNPAFSVIQNEGVKFQGRKRHPSFRMFWHDLKYVVNSFSLGTHIMNKINKTIPASYQRMISKGVNGSLESGKMTALMGPSGAGKTVLLESLIGKRTIGLSGEVYIQPTDAATGYVEVRMAIIPQMDCFVEELSVKETIILASKLKNVHISGDHQHRRTALEMMTRAGLGQDESVMVADLRPGQRKLLAVAAELVNRPNFLVLDEVTTGLDSFSAKLVIELLRELAQHDNIAILCSIHQPAWSIALNFDKIYMLSPVIGRCIYEGSPVSMLSHLATYGFVPQMRGNAADFILDIATGSLYDEEIEMSKMTALADVALTNFQADFDPMQPFTRDFFSALSIGRTRFPFFRQVWILMCKHTVMFFRQRVLLATMIMGYILISAFYSWFFDFPGEASGCPPHLHDLTDDVTYMNSTIFKQLQDAVDVEFNLMKQNTGANMFMILTGVFFIMTPVLYILPTYMQIYWKEAKNGYYDPVHLFIAMSLVDMLPVVLNVMYGMLFYFISDQPISYSQGGKRLSVFLFNYAMLAYAAQSFAYVAGAAFSASVEASLFLGNFAFLSQMLFCGFFQYPYRMNGGALVISFFTVIRWSVGLAFIALFGYDRCGPDGGKEDFVAIKNALELWVMKTLRFVQDDGTTIFNDDNMNVTAIAGAGGAVMMQDTADKAGSIVATLMLSLMKNYISLDGEFRSYGMNVIGLTDDDDLISSLQLLVLIIMLRNVAFCIFANKVKQKF